MPSFKEIYEHLAPEYQKLIDREDFEGHIPGAIADIADLNNKVILDLASGTGRWISKYAPGASFMCGLDHSAHMLQFAKDRLQKEGTTHQGLCQADMRKIPLATDSVDVVLAGWALCYLVIWFPRTWKEELGQGMAEVKRVLKPEGKIIILETMGTGDGNPKIFPGLEKYCAFLKNHGFKAKTLRTDYKFENRKEAVDMARYFFNKEYHPKTRTDKQILMPEYTGLWWCEGQTLP